MSFKRNFDFSFTFETVPIRNTIYVRLFFLCLPLELQTLWLSERVAQLFRIQITSKYKGETSLD